MKSSTPYVAYTLTASPFINVKSVAAGAWTLIGDAGFAPGNANGVHISMGGAQPYVAYVDAESGGLLTIQRYSMGTWQSAGNATIEDANSTVDYFLMFNGTPYMLYNDTSVNKLRVQKFE